jgi:hypothetical protein
VPGGPYRIKFRTVFFADDVVVYVPGPDKETVVEAVGVDDRLEDLRNFI